MDDQILQHRMARGIIIEGGSGILASEWTDVLTRMNTVENVAETTNPAPLHSDITISTMSHGLGASASMTRAIPADWIIWTPIFLRGSISVTHMSVYVEQNADGGALTLAVYNAAGALVKNFGSVSATSVGWKFATVTATTIPSGTNYLAVMANGASGMEIAAHHPAFPLLHHNTSMQAYGSYHASPGSLPATLTIDGLLLESPYLGLRIAP